LPANQALIDPAKSPNWTANKKTKSVRLPGPVYLYRIAEGFIQVGQRLPTKDGGTDVVYQPVIKLGARPGDSWSWTQNNLRHQCTLAKFDEHNGRPSAVVHETVSGSADLGLRGLQIHHIYVQGIGEVQREEFLLLPSREKKVIEMRRLVEDLRPAARTSTGSKPPAEARKLTSRPRWLSSSVGNIRPGTRQIEPNCPTVPDPHTQHKRPRGLVGERVAKRR